MILVDTNVWIDHLRRAIPTLVRSLDDLQVLVHPWVVGELTLGYLSDRDEVLGLLRNLPRAPVLSDEELLTFIEAQGLAGQGIGWVDAQLLASTRLAGAQLWTGDARLAEAAVALGCHFAPG